jgi:uncharacterized LabA/DUF88 family protein
MSRNVAVFVDVANVFYAAKAAGVDIDYVTLLKTITANRDLIRAYAYTGLDPDNENQKAFHNFLARNNYKVVSKDVRKYGDGRFKANLDIELVVDLVRLAPKLDIAVVISGDGDFAPAIRAVQDMGVRVEVVSFRANTSSDLVDVADQFIEITSIAKVEAGGSRSGRRVAADGDEDLSMTEVPDKQSEAPARPRRTPEPREERGPHAEAALDEQPLCAVARAQRCALVAASLTRTPLRQCHSTILSRATLTDQPSVKSTNTTRATHHVAADDAADADAADADVAKDLPMHREAARHSPAPHMTDRSRRCRLQILTAASLVACRSTCAANVAALHSLRAHRDEHSALGHHESRTRLLDRSVTVLAAPTCRLVWRASRFHPTLRHSCARSLRPLVALLTALLR